LERLDADALAGLQLDKLNALLAEIVPHNRFYADKFNGLDLPLKSPDQLAELPLTAKAELIHEAGDDVATNLTYPVEQYVRFHRTFACLGDGLPVVFLLRDRTRLWRSEAAFVRLRQFFRARQFRRWSTLSRRLSQFRVWGKKDSGRARIPT
jgi:hypothetical protein